MARTAATKKLTEATRDLKLAQAELETVRAQTAAALIRQANRPILEHYDRVPDPFRYSDPIEPVRSRRRVTRTLLRDRAEGAYYPFYETEVDLAVMRAEGRNLSAFFVRPVSAFESLANYVFGEGASFEVADTKRGAERSDLARRAQAVIDRFVDDNDLIGDLDREIDKRSREDGEAFLHLREHDYGIELALLEPDQIVEPANKKALDAWLDMDDPGCWTFGVLRRKGSYRPLGYHVIHDDAGQRWDFVKPSHLEHVRRNSIRSAKRGVSDFYQLGDDVQQEQKLRQNTATGAAIQAAIAFIRQHAPGADQSGIEAMVAGNATTSYDRALDGGGTRRVQVEQFRPGTIKDIPKGMEYHAGPLGQLRSPVYIEVAQYVLRAIGGRWNMPEYLISGDASNANFASTLVAESPFVKSREADQRFYGRVFRNVAWKVLKLEWARGKLGDVDWRDVEAALEISVNFPAVASRDRAQQVTEDTFLLDRGIKAPRTVASEHGLDYDEEIAAGAKPIQQQGTLPFPEAIRENCGTGAGGFQGDNDCAGESATLDEIEFPRFTESEDPESGFRKIETATEDALTRAWAPQRKQVMEAWKAKAKGIAERAGLKDFNPDFLDDSMDDVFEDLKYRIPFDLQDHIQDDGLVNKAGAIKALQRGRDKLMQRVQESPRINRMIELEVKAWAREDGQRFGLAESILIASGMADDPEEARGVLRRLKESYP